MKRTIDQWLATAKRGDVFVYHTGMLSFDAAENDGLDPPKPTVRAIGIMSAGDRARRLYEADVVVLTQKRVKPFVFAYRAHKL